MFVQTLHEYMMETKAVEYLMAVAFLGAFILFWRLVARSADTPRDRAKE